MLVAIGLALVVGVLVGLLGGGGSILTVPILVYVLHLQPKPAIATSLFIVGVTSLVAMSAHARAGRVRLRIGLTFAVASMSAAFVGARVARGLRAGILLAAFTVVMTVTALAMFRKRREAEPTARAPMSRTLAIGVAVGSITGLVGAGGGFIVVPALTMLCGLPMAEAIGTSLLVVALNSFAGFSGYVGHVALDTNVLVSMTSSAAIGSVGGALVSRRVPAAVLRQGFAVLVLSVAAYMAYRQMRA